jgi:uncharacterized membrane protein
MVTDNKKMILKMVQLAILTAIVVVLQCLSIPLGATAINLALLPVVIGAAMCGTWAGAWLGLVSGATILISQQAAWFFTINPVATVIVVLVKGTASGLVAGLVYALFANRNKYIGVILAGLAAPLINTGIFILGCCTLFYADFVQYGNVFVYVVTTFVALNFPIEIGINMIFSPTVVRIIDVVKKNKT